MKRSKFWGVLITVIMAIPLFIGLGGNSVFAAEKENTATIIVHKVENPGNPINNNGEIVEGYKPIKGVEFKIYDTTVNPDGIEVKYEDSEGNELKKVTDAEGQVIFDNLPKTEIVGGKSVYSKYVIREISAPEYVTSVAAPVKIEFPVYKVVDGKFTDTELDTIHIYPKNTVFGGAPKFEKYQREGNEGKEDPLGGAKFKLYRLKDNNPEYLQVLSKDGTPSDITWGPVEKAETFTSDKETGIVSVESKNGNYLLPEGIYFFEETETGSDDFSLPSEPVISVKITKDDAGKPVFNYDVADAYSSNEESETTRVINQSAKITKEIVSNGIVSKEGVFGYGMPIDYKVTVDVPKNIDKDYSEFFVTDTHNDALALIKGTLKIGDLEEGVDYILTEDPTFKIDFDLDKVTTGLQLSDEVKKLAGKSLEITYQMSIKKDQLPDTDFENTATLNLTPKPKTTEPVIVKTYGKKFVKVDAADNDTKLKGAMFAVKKGKDEYLTWDKDHVKYEWSILTSVTPYTSNLVVLTSDEKGQFEIKGLKNGNYQLEELVAPEGYAKLLNPLDFSVSEGDYANQKPESWLQVNNKHKGTLPSTGGMGIVAFVAVGIVAIGGAYVYFAKGRRHIEG